MKSRVLLLVCWLLTLSLAGLPVLSVAANSLKLSSHTHCHHSISKVQQHYDSIVVYAAHGSELMVSCEGRCGGADFNGNSEPPGCGCDESQAPCDSSNIDQTVGILQTALHMHPTHLIQLLSDVTAKYRGRDIEPEITPPII